MDLNALREAVKANGETPLENSLPERAERRDEEEELRARVAAGMPAEERDAYITENGVTPERMLQSMKMKRAIREGVKAGEGTLVSEMIEIEE